MIKAIAVIDIGMTNKKIALYDEDLSQLDAEYRVFVPKIVDGLETHNLEAMEEWFLDRLAASARKYKIDAITVSAHGATFVYVGADGKPALPCVYYTHEPGGDFHERFYAAFGDARDLQRETCAARFGALINSAKGIYFARQRFPNEYEKAALVLNYPQYWGYRLTGRAGSDCTYMGCHTYLWDQKRQGFSSVAQALGLSGLMPEKAQSPWTALGKITAEAAEKTGLGADTIVTLGIHDSGAAMIPHFAFSRERGFTLNSTGTWCVTMTPARDYGFGEEEIGKPVFFNTSAFDMPVKTAIFMGGLEMEAWSKALMARHKREDFPPYDAALFREIIAGADCFLLPGAAADGALFPASKARVVEGRRAWSFEEISRGAGAPPCFDDYARAFALLRLSLVMQTLVALEISGLKGGDDLITEGGFRRDDAYNRLLSSALPECRAFLTGVTEASALGAAIVAKMAARAIKIEEIKLDPKYREVEKDEFPGLANYRAAWMELVNSPVAN